MSIVGKHETPEEVEKEVMKDSVFYQKSGGGVTFSGGEPLFQPEFLITLAQRFKDLGIHTAIETSGYASQRTFIDAIKNIDLLLFDIKHYDNNKHIEGTSVPNDGILMNLRNAVQSGKQVIARIPLIPGYNDSLSDAEEFAQLLDCEGVKDVCLLPFHQFGEKKYKLLNEEYEYEQAKALSDKHVSGILEVYARNGLNVQIGG